MRPRNITLEKGGPTRFLKQAKEPNMFLYHQKLYGNKVIKTLIGKSVAWAFLSVHPFSSAVGRRDSGDRPETKAMCVIPSLREETGGWGRMRLTRSIPWDKALPGGPCSPRDPCHGTRFRGDHHASSGFPEYWEISRGGCWGAERRVFGGIYSPGGWPQPTCEASGNGGGGCGARPDPQAGS